MKEEEQGTNAGVNWEALGEWVRFGRASDAVDQERRYERSDAGSLGEVVVDGATVGLVAARADNSAWLRPWAGRMTGVDAPALWVGGCWGAQRLVG